MMGLIPWDSSRGFWDNVAGGIADNTLAKIPGWGWDGSKGFWDNVGGGLSDNANAAAKTIQNVAGNVLNPLKKYWYVPVIVGGVIIGYKLLTRPNPAVLAALSKIRIPE